MTKKRVFFDLDGTLTDSGEGIMNCAAVALEHFGLPVPPRKAMRVFVGPPLKDSFRKHGVPEDLLDEAVSVYRSRYIPVGKYENHPYPGITALLARLKADGYRLFVATSKPEQMAVDILEHFGLANFFEKICGAIADGSRDTKAAVIAYLLDSIGGAENAVMVGDTVFDVIGAAAHGIPTIGVSWGYGETADLENAGAIGSAHTMDELYELLTK